jgi:hypothetical protein
MKILKHAVGYAAIVGMIVLGANASAAASANANANANVNAGASGQY